MVTDIMNISKQSSILRLDILTRYFRALFPRWKNGELQNLWNQVFLGPWLLIPDVFEKKVDGIITSLFGIKLLSKEIEDQPSRSIFFSFLLKGAFDLDRR